MSTSRSQTKGLIALVAIALIVGWVVFQYLSPTPTDEPNNGAAAAAPDRFTHEQFAQAIEAVAATEEADFARARILWDDLVRVFPDDADIRINQAVAVLKWIDTIDQSLSSSDSKVTPEKRQELLDEIDAAYAFSELVTQQLADLPGYDPRVPLIRSAILNSKANRLPYPDDIAVHTQAAEILAEALEPNPAQPLLVASFESTLITLGGAEEALEEKRKDFLYAGWKASPRNLYLLRQAADALLSAQDPRLLELLPPSIEMSRPTWGMVQTSIDRVKPDELVPALQAAIQAGDWQPLRGRLFGWLNVLMGMPSFNSDSKRVNPDPLVLLDTTFLSRLAPTDRGSPPPLPLPGYSRLAAADRATAAAWYDYDFDLQVDVVAAAGTQLQFLRLVDGQLQVDSTLDVGFSATGILPIDLFEVQSPTAPKLPASVAELMIANSNRQPVSDPTNEQMKTVGARHQSLQELLLWGAAGIRIVTADAEDDYAYEVAPPDTGLEALRDVLHVEAADVESDGDLDLLVITQTRLHLMQNNGNRTFRDVTEYCLLPPSNVHVVRAIACDFDRDMDQDFMLVADGQAAVFENLQHSQFRYLELQSNSWQQAAGATDLAFGDFDKNASWDFAASGSAGTSLTLTRSPGPGELEAIRTTRVDSVASEVAIGDLNNDGLLDLALATEAGLQVHQGATEGGFVDGQIVAQGSVHNVQLLDCDYDGQLDILAILDDKPTVWSASTGEPQGKFVDVRLAGINDINGGGRINHYGLGSTLEIWADGQLYSRPVQSVVTHFGLGNAQPDNLRIVFTNGLTQNVEDVATNMLIEEIQLLRGSCPYVYGWDGERFELITDLLWNAPLGLQIARGETLPDRRWENLLLPGELVHEREGAIELRVTEELWEVAYFDHVQLTAIDHPADVRVFTNEKVGPPSLAEHKLFATARTRYPKSATDGYGRDIKEKLLHLDHRYAQAFERQICQGLCEPHFIELDFGELSTEEPLYLFLTGWMYPTDTSLNIGIDQDPERQAPEPPSLWVVDEAGTWVCAQPYMGFPGGKPKSIVVDLEGVFRSDDHRLRIGSSQQIYWDEAFVSSKFETPKIVETPVAMRSANLAYRGFSKPLPRESDQPHWFDYHAVTTAPNWPELDGPFTRFGDVLSLLVADDDEMVVMTSGDEIQLSFSVPDKPLPEGWKRDYVLHSTGWDKDADVNTLSGQGSLPLPFMDQLSYPAPLEQAVETQRVWLKNADTLTRRRRFPIVADQSPRS